MIGQLHNNFRLLASIGAICALLYSPNIYAVDISGNQIMASTDLPVHRNFTIEQIADGIEPGPTGQNGFTTREDSGTITLDFDQAYDIESFKLWNDVVLRAEGVKSFRLDYRTARGMLSSQIFEAAARQADVQIFEFPKISNVLSVDFVILSSHDEPSTATLLPTFAHRIEVREVAFTGKPSNAAPIEGDSATQIAKMEDYIDGLQDIIKEHEADKRGLESDLEKEKRRADSTFALLEQRDATIATLSTNTTATPRTEKHSPSIFALLLGGVIGLGLSSVAGLILRRYRHKPQSNTHILPRKNEKKNRKKSQGFETLKKGMTFSASPMLLGGLPPSLAAIRPVYDAVGRIGFAQNGKPVGKDESFGTGILVSERHILTNRHVWEMFKHRLAGDEATGIEFFGEKDSDKTDFIRFADIEPVCIDGWDAAILTLSHAPNNRKPVTITSRPAETLNDLDIVVVGYPQAHRLTEDIAEVTESDPIFGVKRYSEGKIFRHSMDLENPYGVEAAVENVINPSETMPAICHNASTLGGSSGSAVICKKTGELIALHFGFDSAYEWEEAANLAVAGEDLAERINKITSNVTPVTDKAIV